MIQHRFRTLAIAALLALTAQAERTTHLYEGFEQGIPATWTQEVLSSRQQLWTVESTNLTYPLTAYEGNARAAMRNTTGMTRHYRTRLITPIIDLTANDVYNPILTFAHAQPARNGQFDTLRVWYRASENAQWSLLHEYDWASNAWSYDTLALIQPLTATYQLCFEASENLGRGVLLDAIRIVNSPRCSGISGLSIDPHTYDASISVGMLDISLDLFVTTQEVIPEYYPVSQALFHVENTQTLDFNVTGLSANTIYHVYARTACNDEDTGYTPWVHRMFSTSMGFPFTEDFSGLMGLPETWMYRQAELSAVYKDTSALHTPTVGDIAGWILDTDSLPMTGNHVRCLPSYMYEPFWLITPNIDLSSTPDAIELNFDLALTSSTNYGQPTEEALNNQRFYVLVSQDAGHSWSAQHTLTWGSGSEADYQMATTTATPHHYRIDMSAYRGKTVRIAFVSDMADYGVRTYTHLDNVAIMEGDAVCGVPSSVRIDLRDSTATLSWQSVGTMPSIVELSDSPAFINLLDTVCITASTYTFHGLTPGTIYYARVRHACESSDWMVRQFTTAYGTPYMHPFTSIDMPDTWTRYFGIEADSLLAGAAVLESPSYSGWNLSQRGQVYGMRNQFMAGALLADENKAWLVSPSIYVHGEDAQSIRLAFCQAMSATSTPTQSVFTDTDDRFMVLVSEDDGQSWKPANTTTWGVNGQGDYDLTAIPYVAQQTFIDFSKYIGKTIRIAFYAGSKSHGSANYFFLGDLSVAPYDPACGGVINLSLSASQAQLTATYQTQGDNHVVLELSTDARFTTLIDSVTTTQNSYTFSGLSYNTYYYVRARQTCSPDEWSSAGIKTLCGVEAIPFACDFEQEQSGGLPGCWEITQDYDGYPFIIGSADYAHSGSKSLSWGVAPNSTDYPVTSWACMPEIDSVARLQLSFYLRLSSERYDNPDLLEVGVMTNPADSNTFTLISSIQPSSQEYKLYTIDLNTYTGTGRYITFRRRMVGYKTQTMSYPVYTPFLLDDVEAYPIPTCQRMSKGRVSGISANGATVRFDMVNSVDYRLLFATEELLPDTVTAAATNIAVDTVVNTSYCTVTDILEANTDYYVYIRALCGGEDPGIWSEAAPFTTLCEPIEALDLGTEDFSSDESLECWHFGFVNQPRGCSTDLTKAGRTSASKATYGDYLELSKKAIDTYDLPYRDGAYAIMPELELRGDSINLYQVNFRAATTSKSVYNVASVTVGVVTTPDNLDTYTELATIQLEYAGNYATEPVYSISLANYHGDYNGNYGRFIMFQTTAGADSMSYVLLDDISVERAVGCVQILNHSVDSIGLSTARFHWEDVSAEHYQVLLTQCQTNRPDTLSDTDILLDTITTALSLEFTSLTPATTYFAYVRGYCGENYGLYSAGRSFHTAITTPWMDDLDSYPMSSLPLNEWVGFIGIAPVTTSFSAAGLRPNTTNNNGFYFTNQPSTVQGMSGQVLRALYEQEALNAIVLGPQIVLHGATGNQGYQLSYKVSLTSSTGGTPTSTENRHLQVLISTDGGRSYLPIYTWSTDGQGDGDYNSLRPRAIRATVDLTDYADMSVSIAFATDAKADGVSSYLYLDSVGIDLYDASCIPVSRLRTSSQSATTTLASWRSDSRYQGRFLLELSEREDFLTMVRTDTASADSLALTGLTPGTHYYLRVSKECGSEPVTTSFYTPESIPAEFDFLTTIMPGNWPRYRTSVNDVLSGMAEPSVHTATGWKLVDGDLILDPIHWRILMQGTDIRHWVSTPEIDLQSATPGDTLVLQFNAYLTATKAATRADRDKGTDDRFIVLISADGGHRWVQLAEWNNKGTGDYVLNNIPEGGRQYKVNLSAYAGQIVNVAFYAESTVANATNYLHVGNISVAQGTIEECLPISYRYSVTLCEGEHYQDQNFDFIAKANMQSVLTQHYQAANDCDSVIYLTVNVLRKQNTAVYHDMCRGDILIIDGDTVTRSGVYYEHLLTTQGCDSTIIWTITMHEQEWTEEWDTISSLQLPYIWHEQEYWQTGEYNYLTTTTFGCDSLVTLYLIVVPYVGWEDVIRTDDNDDEVLKFIYQGHLYIRRRGTLYTVEGLKIKEED